MSFHRIVRGAALVGLIVWSTIISATTTAVAQGGSSVDTGRSLQRTLERLPYYGVFDYIAFGVDRGIVTLVGYSYEGSVKAAAAMATKRVSGVDEVANKIEVLPASQNDDRIRWATFYRSTPTISCLDTPLAACMGRFGI